MHKLSTFTSQFHNFSFKFMVDDFIVFSYLHERNGINSFKKAVKYSLSLNLQREIKKIIISLNKNRKKKLFKN